MSKPSLIIVSGPPGAGKTTLAHSLGGLLGMPVVARDEIKEGLVHGRHAPGPPRGGSLARDAFAIFYANLHLLIDSSVSVIAEAAFMRVIAEPELSRLIDTSVAVQLHCTVQSEVAEQRFAARAIDPVRQNSHADGDAHVLAAIAAGVFDMDAYGVLDLDVSFLQVDTESGCEPTLEAIVGFVSGALR